MEGEGGKSLLHLGYHSFEIRTYSIHLIYKTDPGDSVSIGLVPYSLGLGFYPTYSTEDNDYPIQNSQGPLHFNGKVYMSRSINDVYAMILPIAGSSGRGDSNPPLLFLVHPVHSGRTLIYLPHPVNPTCVVENPLSGSGLACIYMGCKSDISNLFHPESL